VREVVQIAGDGFQMKGNELGVRPRIRRNFSKFT
jgi:hypothetical protein